MIYEIWMEGYAITGGTGQASYVGTMEGDSFEDAVRKWYKNKPDFNFDEKSLTYWGCGLFPSEAAAKRTFG